MPEPHEMLTDEELEAIQARCDAATPGDWAVNTNYPFDGMGGCGHRYVESEAGWVCSTGTKNRNVEFIANAKQDIPRLISDLAAVKEDLRELLQLRDRWIDEVRNAGIDDQRAWAEEVVDALSQVRDMNGEIT